MDNEQVAKVIAFAGYKLKENPCPEDVEMWKEIQEVALKAEQAEKRVKELEHRWDDLSSYRSLELKIKDLTAQHESDAEVIKQLAHDGIMLQRQLEEYKKEHQYFASECSKLTDQNACLKEVLKDIADGMNYVSPMERAKSCLQQLSNQGEV